MQAIQLPTLLLGGFVGGFFGSAVGSAGLVSLVILLFFGFSPHAAIGTTRPAAIVLEGISALRYWKDGVLTPLLLRRALALGLFASIGSVTGAVLIAQVSDQTLRLLLASVILCMTIFLCLKKNWGMIERPARQRRHALIAIGTMLTGLYGGLFGFTFGTLILLVLVGFGYTLLQGAAMGRVIGALMSLTSTFVLAWHGYIHFPSAIALSIGFGIGGWIGASVAAKAGSRYVKVLLTAVVLCSVAKLLFDYVAAL